MDNGSVSYSGKVGPIVVNVDYGSDIGTCGIDYKVNGAPSRFIMQYNSGIIYDTGYVGLNTSSNYDDLIAAGVAPENIKLQIQI